MNGTPSVPGLYAASRCARRPCSSTGLIRRALRSTRREARRAGRHAYEISRELLAQDIPIDARPQAGIRISPHFTNSDDELRLAIDAIKDILATGWWENPTAAAGPL